MAECPEEFIQCPNNFCYGCGMVVKVKSEEEEVCPYCSSEDLEELDDLKHSSGEDSSDSYSTDSSEEGATGGIKKTSILWMILEGLEDDDREDVELNDQTYQEKLWENAERRRKQRRIYRPTLDDRRFESFVLKEMENETPSARIVMGKLLRRDAHLFPAHDALADKLCEDEVTEVEYMKLQESPPDIETTLEFVVITKEQIATGLQCSVCKEDYREMDQAVKLECRHMYHQRCLVPWLESKRDTCPDCRRRIDPWKIGPTLQALYKRPRPRGCSLPTLRLDVRGQNMVERRNSAEGNPAVPDQRPQDWIVFD